MGILDMGDVEYGDCIYLEVNGLTMLIDGAHPGDFDKGANIRSQLKKLRKEPFEVDLLVVTHSHNDHIGCLPEMIKNKKLKAKFALVSDPDHRWGKPGGQDALGLDAQARSVLDVLGEELPPPDSPNFAAAVDAGVTLEKRYRDMIEALKNANTKVVRYRTDPLKPITDLLKGKGVEILGPTKKHLEICAKALTAAQHDAVAALRDALGRDATMSTADSVRSILEDSQDALDAAKVKGAINDLSIVMMVKLGNDKVLLPGDMQFADAEVTGLETEMKKLVTKVAKKGPYKVVKLAHHTSYNGWDEDLHRTILPAEILVHSGGRIDEDHPEKKTLEMMEDFSAGHTFLRTDRNGLIVLEVKNGQLKTTFDGNPNDFTPNQGHDTGLAITKEPQVSVQRTSEDVVRVIAEIPNHSSKVTISVEIAGSGEFEVKKKL
jgi:beta-lactamase superfamily II metal-dependent hydrolase